MLSNSQMIKELKCICFDYIIKSKQMLLNKTMENCLSGDHLRTVLQSKFFKKDTPAAIVYDIDFLDNKIQYLKDVFPSAFHAISVKANPLPAVLNHLHQSKIGLEVASVGELYLAMKSGYDAKDVVFDSPAKSMEDLEFALTVGVMINADNFQELERINTLYNEIGSKSKVGLRVNPQIGVGTIRSSSVAGRISKFGVPLETCKREIIDSFKQYPWLSGLHLHSGSQGMSIDQLVAGVRKTYKLAQEIQFVLAELDRKLTFFDIGGGFPVSYSAAQKAPDLKLYAEALQKCCPRLFDGSLQLITEFGRYVFANSAFAISQIEYIKETEADDVLVVHLGADFMLRTAYKPEDWPHSFSICTAKGQLKENNQKSYSIAGPLCFGGDFIGHSVALPQVEDKDLLLIKDVGAYTLSMWSRYNSRRMPMVLGLHAGKVKLLKKRENLADILKFWT